MNLEKGIWNEDPTKAWMKEYQCSDWKSYLKDIVFPAVEDRKNLLNSFWFSFEYKRNSVYKRHEESFSSIPIGLLTGTFDFSGRQLNICTMRKQHVQLPVFLDNGTVMKNIVDEELESLGERDIFFSIQADSNKYGNVWVYFTPAHLEEACCILKTSQTIFKLDQESWRQTIMRINDGSWERLGSMNPFSVLHV